MFYIYIFEYVFYVWDCVYNVIFQKYGLVINQSEANFVPSVSPTM